MAQGAQGDENGRIEEPEDGVGSSRLAAKKEAVHVQHVCTLQLSALTSHVLPFVHTLIWDEPQSARWAAQRWQLAP